MNVKTFIDRPVFASVISILIVLLGIIGLSSLPIETFPDIAPPTIMVSASYPGASAESIQKSVVVPLEQAINGVEDMMYMTSSSSNSGSASITVYFKQGTDPDMAAVNVQNKVATATGLLPAEVNQIGVTTMKRQTSMLQVFSLHSPNNKYSNEFLTNYMKINLVPNIQRIQGIGQVLVMGADYSLRIWLKPEQMAKYHLIPSDITAVLAEQNIESATGALGADSKNTFQYTMKYKGRLVTPDQFDNIVIKSQSDGTILHLSDVAKVELGQVSYSFDHDTDGHNGVSAMVFQLAGSNATAVNNNITKYFKEVQKTLPEGIELTSIMSTNDFLYASIHSVVETLLIAILLVILIVYFFLQDIRSTLIPIVAIIVSLIGTFAFIHLLGFSLNLLTLFALVLVIGTVVDDAIVVVEAVQARFNEGEKSPYKASVDAMKTLVNPIVSTSLVFMAVFIPVSFMPGTSGTFYQQFGLTMAIAVAISLLNALTLSPALCAILLRPARERGENEKKTFADRMRVAYFATYNTVLKKYKNNVLYMVHHKALAWIALVIAVLGLILLMNNTQSGFIPDEDQGVVMVNVTTAPGSSLATTSEIMDNIENRIKDIPEIYHFMKVSGYGLIAGQGNSYGMFIVRLKDWSLRKDKDQAYTAVINKIYARTMDVKDAQIFSMSPGMIPGYGMGNSVELHVLDKQGGTLNDLFANTQKYAGALNQRPEISRAFSTFDIRYPQYLVDVDAAKCKRAGISPQSVLSVMSGYYGGIYASNINRFTKVYRVMIQAAPEDRLDVKSLDKIFVRNGTEMAPISQFVSLKRVYGSEVINRFNLYPSIQLNVQPAVGYSTGDAIATVKDVASQVLPKGYGYDFGGISREENNTKNSTVLIYAICILFIYLILAALYESYFTPFAVLLAIPFGLAGSFLFAKLMGIENNIYLQTGLIMLIGLISKTAILLTEYATERRKAGMSLIEAAYSAAAARLRPILMTALTMIFGMLPLVLASGVGARGNSSLGTGVVGGMVVGTIAMLLVVPVFFVIFQSIQEKFVPHKYVKITDPRILQEMQQIKEEAAAKGASIYNKKEDQIKAGDNK